MSIVPLPCLNPHWVSGRRPTCVARTGPRSALSKGQKSKFRKTKFLFFFSCHKEYYAQKLGSWVKKTVTCKTRTDRQTEVLITEYPMRASAFQASACDMSGPT